MAPSRGVGVMGDGDDDDDEEEDNDCCSARASARASEARLSRYVFHALLVSSVTTRASVFTASSVPLLMGAVMSTTCEIETKRRKQGTREECVHLNRV